MVLSVLVWLLIRKSLIAGQEWAFWALLVIGAVETLLGQLPITRRRRSAVIVLSTIGVVMLVAAFPFRYSGERLSVLWLVEAEALLLEAQSNGLEASYPEFGSLMKEYDDGVVLYKAEQMEVWNKNVVSDSTLKSYYEQNKSKFVFPEKVNVAELYVDTDTLAAKLYDSLLHGADFSALVARYEQDEELKAKGGERGFQPVDTDESTKLGATLNVGEVSEPSPVEGGGYGIIKLVAREPARQKTYEEAGAEISNAFQDSQSKLLEQQWLDRVRQRYPVKQYKERLVDAFKKTQ